MIVAAFGAVLIAVGIACLIIQLVVSIQNRQATVDLTGDPWGGRTLEWLTSSPPAPYNFAVVPEVHELDVFHEMKRHGVAYRRPAAYTDIFVPRNTGVGVVLGAAAFVLGFAMVWHIWWLAIVSGLVILIAIAVRSFNDDTELRLTAAEVKAIEDQRYQQLAKAPRRAWDRAPLTQEQPVPREAT